MPNWSKIVREKLTCERLQMSGLTSSQRDDIMRELAAHLEECYAQARSEGLPDHAAVELTLEQVEDWRVLTTEIARTKSKEDSMNHTSHRTKTVLLPAIAILFGFGLVLLFLDRAAILQRLIWMACMALLFAVVASEANRLNPRTRSVWLPGFVTLTAASLLMFAEEIVLAHDPSFYFTDLSLRPGHFISGLPRWFYIGWLIGQVLCGALGAFLSRHAGGTRAARVVAGAFPALVMFLLCGLVIPISALFEHNTFALSHPSRLALGILIWAAVPAIALLLGAAPFLRNTTSGTAAS
jgi:hypothetical protein